MNTVTVMTGGAVKENEPWQSNTGGSSEKERRHPHTRELAGNHDRPGAVLFVELLNLPQVIRSDEPPDETLRVKPHTTPHGERNEISAQYPQVSHDPRGSERGVSIGDEHPRSSEADIFGNRKPEGGEDEGGEHGDEAVPQQGFESHDAMGAGIVDKRWGWVAYTAGITPFLCTAHGLLRLRRRVRDTGHPMSGDPSHHARVHPGTGEAMNQLVEWHCPSPESVQALGRALGEVCPFVVCVALGDLGAGKTTFTQGLGSGLGIHEDITSPTFALMVEYEADCSLLHVDAYRLAPSGV